MKSPLRLIAITDPFLMQWHELETATRIALAAGLPAVMLRDKSETTDRQLIALGHGLMGAARAAGALLIVNRRLALAAAIGARAVHLGAEGPTPAEARDVLGPEVMIGYSAHGVAEALAAFQQGVDYVTYSPIYETPNKIGILEPTGTEPLRDLCRRAPGPVIALGGINPANAREVIAAGATGIASVRGIYTGDPAANTMVLLGAVDQAR